VLVSAYACEPGLGSESGIGWNWVREIAQRHDVWVITRENNVARVAAAARELGLDGLHVEGFDLPRWSRFWKRGSFGAVPYFYLWQLALAFRARALDRRVDFDVVHHVTFASSWIPSGLCFVGKPFVWGPVGRHPRIPDRFLARASWRARAGELLKSALKRVCELADPLLGLTRARADLILSIGPEVAAALPPAQRARTLRELACGTESVVLDARRFERNGRFEVLFAGRLVDLKGVRLALEAFARLAARAPEVTLVFVGDGPQRAELERRTAELGLTGRVEITGHRPRAEVLARMARSQVFLFPSFEGAGMVVVEALAAGNPVVCLDCGGPRAMIEDEHGESERGLCAPVGATFDATVDALAHALARLHDDEALRVRLARAAASWASERATWPAKGARIAGFYAFAEAQHARGAA
jgi:glycosyltransferase involved in cell wall biosynthesis